MKRIGLRFTLRQLLAMAALIALALPALINASLWWATAWFTGALVMLAVSLLGILYRGRRRRAFWVGFALFGWGYMILLYGPFLGSHFGPRLATTKALAYLQPLVQKAPVGDSRMSRVSPSDFALNSELYLAWKTEIEGNGFPLPRWDHFQQVGHSLFALLLASGGGLLARWFYSTRSQD